MDKKQIEKQIMTILYKAENDDYRGYGSSKWAELRTKIRKAVRQHKKSRRKPTKRWRI